MGKGKSSFYLLISGSTVLAVLILWKLITAYQLVSPLFIPPPEDVFQAFIQVAFMEGYKGASLWIHLGISLQRIGMAFMAATIIGVPLGLLSGYFKLIHAIISPILNFYRPLPPLAYYTVLIIWLGIGDLSKVTLLFLAGFAPIFLSSMSAVKGIDPSRPLVARILGASTYKVFLHVIVPSSLPEILTGLRTALGFIYTTLVAAEMVAAVSGVGWMVLDASKYLQSDIMFVGIIVMGITGVLLDICFRFVEKKLVPWKGKGN